MKKIILILLCLFIGLALNQWNIPFVNAQEDDSEEFTLEEITVTAEKIEQNLQAVPRSLAVISADDLDLRSASSVKDVLSTAGINFQGFNAQFFIRGIGPSGTMMNDPGNEPSVQFNVDGILGIFAPSQGVNPVLSAMNDVERIEIVRGPAGAISGRMAAAGTINVITKDPDFNKLDANFSIQTGNYNTINTSAATNIPLKLTGLNLPSFIENLSFRVAVRQDKHSEYIHNSDGEGVSGNQNFYTMRTKMKWQPVESLTILAQYSYTRDKSNTGMGVPAVDQVQTWPAPSTPHPDDPWLNATASAGGEGRAKENYSESVEVSWVSKFGTLIGKYDKSWVPVKCQERETGPGAVPDPGGGFLCYDGDIYQNEYEVRMTSSDESKIRWMLGAYKYYKKEYSGPDRQLSAIEEDAVTIFFSDFYGRDNYFMPTGYNIRSPDFNANDPNQSWALPGVEPTVPGSAIIVSNWASRPIDSYSYFGNVTVPFFGDRHRFSLGLRKTIEDKKRANVIAFFQADRYNTNNGLPHFTFVESTVDPPLGQWICDNCYIAENLEPFVMKTETNPISYTIGWEYDWRPDVLLYANINNGFKPGGYSPESVPNVYYKPEYLINYAIGTRSRWFNNRLQLNFEAYLMDYDNLQTGINSEAPISYTAPSGTTYTQPIRWQSRVINFEKTYITGFELDYDWLITPRDRLQGSLAYKNAKYGDKIYHIGTTGLPPGHPEWADFGGRPMPQAPKTVFIANYSHRFTIGDMTITPRFDAKYSSKYITFNEYWWTVIGAELWQPAYWKYDAYLNIGPDDGRWQINAYMKNISETVVRAIAFFNTEIEDPRTMGFGLTIKF